MVETKISLSLLVPGAGMVSQQEAENKPKESYDEHRMLIEYVKGKGKFQKKVKETLVVKTRKQKLVTQNINICEEAYNHMLSTPATHKLAKPVKYNMYGEVVERVWDSLDMQSKLKAHFDVIAYDLGAVSYSYEVFDN